VEDWERKFYDAEKSFGFIESKHGGPDREATLAGGDGELAPSFFSVLAPIGPHLSAGSPYRSGQINSTRPVNV
jgi:hypothetical protein